MAQFVLIVASLNAMSAPALDATSRPLYLGPFFANETVSVTEKGTDTELEKVQADIERRIVDEILRRREHP